MPDSDSELDLRNVLGVVRRRGWIVVLLVVVGVLVGYVYSASQPDRYAATAQVQVRDPNAGVLDSGRTQTGNASNAEREVATQLEFARSSEVKGLARDKMAEDGVTGSVTMTASTVSGTDLINFRVESGSPEVSQAGANAFAQAYVDQRQAQLKKVFAENAADLRARADERTTQIADIDDQLNAKPRLLSPAEVEGLETERNSLGSQRTDLQAQANELDVIATSRAAGIVVIDPANLPTSPFEPKPMRTAAMGGLIGLLLGLAVVFLLERLDDRVSSVEQVEELTGGLTVLGTIPVYGRRRLGRHRLPHKERALVAPASPAAEAYRTLQTSLRFSSLGEAKKVLLVTSSVSGEGKTTCTANLAMVLAENGQRVVVVSADLRKPTIAGMFGVDEHGKGLTSVVLGDATLAETLVSAKQSNGRTVYVLPAGPLPNNPTEMLASERFGQVMRELSGAGADFVLVDCAPVLPVSDPLVAAQHADGVLVLTAEGESKRADLVECVSRLRQVQADVIGIVVNGMTARASGYTGYGYAYHEEPAAGA